jgi:glycosyltransferase involved in cell wall biosynthesis
MTKPGSVSVVIAVRNGLPYLREAIASVLDQTYQPLEVVVVDDASSDDSAVVAESFGRGVRVLRNARNRERAWSRNRGIGESKGEFVAFLDADDLWDWQKLEKQIAVMQADETVGLCYCQYRRFDDVDGERQWGAVSTCPALDGGADRLLVRHNRFGLSTVVVRRQALDRAGLFDTTRWVVPCEDYDLWLRMGAVTRFRRVDECLASYRVHPGQSTANVERLDATSFRVRYRYVARHPAVLAGKSPAEVWEDLFYELDRAAGKARWSRQYGIAVRHYLRLLRRRPFHLVWLDALLRSLVHALLARGGVTRGVKAV